MALNRSPSAFRARGYYVVVIVVGDATSVVSVTVAPHPSTGRAILRAIGEQPGLTSDLIYLSRDGTPAGTFLPLFFLPHTPATTTLPINLSLLFALRFIARGLVSQTANSYILDTYPSIIPLFETSTRSIFPETTLHTRRNRFQAPF